MLAAMKNSIVLWWKGEYVPPGQRGGGVIILTLGTYKRHWTSKFAHWVVEFCLTHWKWILGFFLGVLGLIFTALK